MSQSNEILEACKLKEDLLKKHEGQSLDEILNGEIFKTPYGSCYKIEITEKLEMKTLDGKKAVSQILRDIKLIPGIGPIREQLLINNGYKTINDLTDHPQYSQQATEFLNTIQESPDSLTNYICNRYSQSHPHLLLSSCLKENSDYLFFDIETLGLKDYPVILMGMGRVTDDEITVKQYLLTDLEEEKAVLNCFLLDVDESTIFVSFNGRSFDLPFIKHRLRNYSVKTNLNNNHLDLLHFSRRNWSTQLPNCQLQTLEKHLFNLKRVDDVPSSLVPEFYKTYLQTGNIGPLIPIVEHNQQDIITLAMILSQLREGI
jgi:hypothetical protein